MRNSAIMKSSVDRNLGSYIDDKLSMNSHINKVCNSSFYYLPNSRGIRKHLSRDSSETLIHAFEELTVYSMDCHRYKLIRFKEFKTQLQGLFLSNLSFAI